MGKLKASNGQIKQAVKEALQELLTEDREFLRELLLEAYEDMVLSELIVAAHKDPKNKPVPRSAVMKVLRGK